MTRYYFDIRDSGKRIHDDVGVELPNIQSAQQEAAVRLAEMAPELVKSRRQHHTVVEVRDDDGLALEVSLSFVVKPHLQRKSA